MLLTATWTRHGPSSALIHGVAVPGSMRGESTTRCAPCHQVVKASGLRWISLMWLGHVPWAGRHWALPVLTVLAPSARYYRAGTPAQKAHPVCAADDHATATLAGLLAGGRQRPCWTCSTAPIPGPAGDPHCPFAPGRRPLCSSAASSARSERPPAAERRIPR